MFKKTLYGSMLMFSEGHNFKLCATPDNLGITSLGLNPDPPLHGEKLQVILHGSSLIDINKDVNVNLKLDVLGIPVADLKFNLCDSLDIACPVSKLSKYQATFNYQLPDKIPKNLEIQATLNVVEGDKKLSCLKMETQVNIEGYSNYTQKQQSDDVFHYWNKQYGVGSESEYLTNFYNNLQEVLDHNSNTDCPYKLGLNQFSYLNREDYRKYLMPNRFPVNSLRYGSSDKVYLPDSIDWRDRGAVTPIKNQGQCGSCWAFSTTGSLEGAYYLKTGKLTALSEEELVDCDKVDQGCNGGLMDNAFKWIQQNGGLCSEADYPYLGSTNACSLNCNTVNDTNITSFTDVNPTENDLMKAVSARPVSIAIEADNMGFQFYRSGVYTGTCGTKLDHGVLLVGYGTEDGKDYWLVKNSWGEVWGDKGYIKIERGKDQKGGQCGILLSASYPVL